MQIFKYIPDFLKWQLFCIHAKSATFKVLNALRCCNL
jgi:hypothetical protein